MQTQKLGYVDNIEIVHKNKEGKILSEKIINNGWLHRLLCKLGLRHNSMTATGFAGIAGLIGNVGSISPFTVIGIGTNNTSATVNDTALLGSVKLSSATVSRVTTTYTNDTLQLVHTFSAANDNLTGTNAIVEIGCFNGLTNGTDIMCLRQVYSPADSCNWDNGDTLQVTVKIKCMQGT